MQHHCVTQKILQKTQIQDILDNEIGQDYNNREKSKKSKNRAQKQDHCKKNLTDLPKSRIMEHLMKTQNVRLQKEN